jgi:aconitate hydratase
MLVVAYALAGNIKIDMTKEPLGYDSKKRPVYLKDLWPSPKEIADTVRKCVTPAMFRTRYANVFNGTTAWKKVKINKGKTYGWDSKSTYVKSPPYFDGMTMEPAALRDIEGARILGLFGDSITTDHISPAGSFKKDSPAGEYLVANGVAPADFNSYGARRGNHEVMMRGTFANIRIRNEMMGGAEGGNTVYYSSSSAKGEAMSIYDAAMKYQAENVPTIIVAGKEYGTGSSRDWAAKGPRLLGVGAVVAESYERIHRSNLIGMGILPLEFTGGKTRADYALTGRETIDIGGLSGGVKPRQEIIAQVTYPDGKKAKMSLITRIDTLDEVAYFENGGILHYVLRNLVAA